MGHQVQLKQNQFRYVNLKKLHQNERKTKFITATMSQTSVIKEYQSPSPLNDIMLTFNVHVFHIFCAMTQNIS